MLLKPRLSASAPLANSSPFLSQFQGILLPTLESFIMPPQNKVIIYTKLHTVMKMLFSCIVQLIVIINISKHNLPWKWIMVLFLFSGSRFPLCIVTLVALDQAQPPGPLAFRCTNPHACQLMVVLLCRRQKQTLGHREREREKCIQWKKILRKTNILLRGRLSFKCKCKPNKPTYLCWSFGAHRWKLSLGAVQHSLEKSRVNLMLKSV